MERCYSNRREISVKALNIVKNYNAIQALKSVSLEVEKGELYGIIGPDGAGKSTLFRILATLILSDSGSATIEGYDVVKDYKSIRKIIGYMPGKFSLYQDLTVEENLNFFASVFGTTLHENQSLIEDIYCQIEPFKNRLAGKLSGGMKQKLALCCALIHYPSVLYLDEPTTGVDPSSRKEFWQMLKKLKERGITIIVSTPYMDEANLCDRISLIRNGEFFGTDTPTNIINNLKTQIWALSGDNMYSLLLAARNYPQVSSCYTFGNVHHVTFETETPDIEEFIKNMRLQKINNIQIEKVCATIEDCYMIM